jgi:flagellar motor switch protein FliN/FliY
MNSEALIQVLIEQMRVVLGTTLDAPVRVSPATTAGQMWKADITLPRGLQLALAFDAVGAGELVRVMVGQDEPSDDTVKSSLRDLCNQIVTGAAAKFDATMLDDMQIGEPQLADSSSTDVVISISCPTLAATLIIAIASTGGSAGMGVGDSRVVEAIQAPPPTEAERLDVLLDIDLPLVVRFGCTELPLRALSRLGPGSLIDLSRVPDDPVELLVSDRVVARGEVVVVSGNYGIRVLEIVGRRDARPAGVQ